MCGICGFVNLKKKINNEKDELVAMTNSIARRGPDENGYSCFENAMLGHRRLIVVDPDGGKQPMTFKYNDNTYTIVYNGQIYNTSELRDILKENGFTFESHSDTEVLLKAFVHFGKEVVNYLNGIFAFAIWNENKKELFMARDHFGVKPLFYTFKDNYFIFGSEIKAIASYPSIELVIDNAGIGELLGVGPAHTPGITVFKDILEVKPASFLIYNKDGIYTSKYWKLTSKPHTDSLGKTCDKVRFLLEDSIKRQLVSDVPLCTFLSGGLDSSIVSLYASNYCKDNGLPPLETYSIDYVDNDKNFVKSDFQPNSDDKYIDIMTDFLHTNHHKIFIYTP